MEPYHSKQPGGNVIERALCPVLIGREKELTLLEDALLAANRGEGQVVVLAGEAGLGKTRLATQLQKRALKGGTAVIWGGCSEADLALPYLPFLEAIGNYLAAADLDLVRQRLGSVRRELAQLFPQLETDAVSHEVGDPTQGKLRLFEAILALLRIPADERSLLVVVEDLHWADASTRELLDYLTRRLRSTRIMVLATYRNDELHRKHPLLPMVQGWRRTQSAQVVELEPLPPAQVASMVSAIFDGETVGAEFRDFMHNRSDGNPFVIEELLKAALDRGDIYRSGSGWDRKSLADLKLPQTVRDTILLRVERLTAEQAEILRIASVLGPSFSYPTLVAVSGRDQEMVKAALRACIQQQLMEEESESDGRYRFRHALTREAIYEDMIAPDRMELHARAADVLRQLTGTQSVDLAYHLVAAGHWDEAVPVCIKAAEDAERRRGYREAIDLYGRVLPHLHDKLSRGQTICRLGNSYWLAGDPRAAQHHLQEGVALLEECGQGMEAARHRLILGRCHWELGRPKAARAEYESARATLEPAGPSEDLANAYVRLAAMHLFDLDGPKAVATAERAVAVAEAAGVDPPRIWAYNFLGAGLTRLGRHEEGLAFLERSYREASERDLHYIAANAASNMIPMLAHHYRPQEALAKVELIKTQRSLWELFAGLFSGMVYWHLGEPQPAREALEKSLALGLEAEISNIVRRSRNGLAIVYTMLNRFEDAGRLISEDEPEVDRQDALIRGYARLRLRLDTGNEQGAMQEALRELPGLRLDSYPMAEELWLIDSAVEAFLRTGRTAEASELTTKTRAAGLSPNDPYVSRMEGRLALATGAVDLARDRLAAAADFFGNVCYRTEERRTRRSLAAVLAALGDRTGAEAQLRTVLQDANNYGHIFEAESARQQLLELGFAVEKTPVTAAEHVDLQPVSERLVTVMFVDVRGYTAMTGKEAPHEMADKLSTLYRWAQQEIERQHGRATHHAGDAVMATFNISGVRLDHTLHALQAAIAIRDKAAYAGLPVGIGIAVGAAVVGQLTEASEPTAIGETPNLAARLQANAAAGEILLSEEAFRRVRDWLKQQNLAHTKEELTLKGFEAPVIAYRLRAAARTGKEA